MRPLAWTQTTSQLRVLKGGAPVPCVAPPAAEDEDEANYLKHPLEPHTALELPPAPHRKPSSAGLIVISGPPLSGKRTLGHFLNQYLPKSVHLAQTDPAEARLRGESVQSLDDLTRQIRSELGCGKRVVFSARLSTPAAKRQVLKIARRVGAPALLVEVAGTDPEALERVTELASTLTDLREVLGQLCALLRPAQPTRPRPGSPAPEVPTVTVPADAAIEDQVKAVLDGWGRLGAVD